MRIHYKSKVSPISSKTLHSFTSISHLIPKLQHEAQHVNPLITKMFTTYNQSFHKSIQIQGESNWCTNTSQFAFINHFNPSISQHLQCLLKHKTQVH
jgi:hypothetical protein